MYNNFSNQTNDYNYKNSTPYGSDYNNKGSYNGNYNHNNGSYNANNSNYNHNNNSNTNVPTKNSNQFLTIQNCRQDIIGELDAIIQYESHLIETDDPTAKATIQDIVNEEKLHVGQLMGLLFYLDPTSKTQFEKGFNEFINDDRRN